MHLSPEIFRVRIRHIAVGVDVRVLRRIIVLLRLSLQLSLALLNYVLDVGRYPVTQLVEDL